jgi:hypothetical protein
MGERVTTDLLGHRTISDLLNQASSEIEGGGFLRAARIARKPIIPTPGVGRWYDLRMLATVLACAVGEEQMADDTPGTGNVKLRKQVQQAVHYHGTFLLAGPAETAGAK